ncbi:hypothetical protein UFOVP645_17 [uncultured Caudovirales phage]|uniref:Uncharacterized protein n=1 Tax=uncultured Caudovirales phage TaxID=2100421 RepID=A0A6J5N835_9CAUD|nr:hypothetical protein UFOVP645_17 [uncultured Caudovirales phage]
MRKMNKFLTLNTTSGSPVTTGTIGETQITIISGLSDHYVKLNGTADTSSIIIPQGASIDFEIPIGSTISAISHSGQGHLTVVY